MRIRYKQNQPTTSKKPKQSAKTRTQSKLSFRLAPEVTLIAGLCLIMVGTLAFLHTRNQIDTDQKNPVPFQQYSDKSIYRQGWVIHKIGINHEIEGYASEVSVAGGATLDLHISCSGKSYKTEIYRMGYYEGKGAALADKLANQPCLLRQIPVPDPQTGLVNLNWPVSLQLSIPKSWQPGVYLVKLTTSSGYQNYIPFTLRSSGVNSKTLFVHAVNTDNAYNKWGGNSLYSGRTPDIPNIKRAVKVSFNRPFSQKGGGQDGSGFFLRWEYPMIKFLEEYGYNTDYLTDVDIQNDPSILKNYKTIIITGHNEYWSKQMLDGYKAALASGTNLANFAANTAFRPIRYEADPNTGQPNRIMVDYKNIQLDPQNKLADKSSVTAYSWRSPPLSMPESEFLGLAWAGENKISADLVVSNSDNWIFGGTGLKNGDKIPGLVGYEFDTFTNALPHPPNIQVMFHSPVVAEENRLEYADAGYYQTPNGGQVFDAGTIQWAWGLEEGNIYYSPQIVQITKNILNRFDQ